MQFPVSLVYNKDIYNADVSRDIKRARLKWAGEDRIYLLPDLEKPRQWIVEVPQKAGLKLLSKELAIPSQTFNIISVINLTEDGYYFPPASFIPEKWGWRIPNDLYLQWINEQTHFCYCGKTSAQVNIPTFNGNEINYEQKEIFLKPGPTLPIVGGNDKDRTFTMCWPPPDSGHPIPPISPEAESVEFNGLYYEWGKLHTED